MTRVERIIDGKYKFQTYHVQFEKQFKTTSICCSSNERHK